MTNKPHLTILGLEANGINDSEGGFDLFEAGCAHAISLEKLYLANNQIGERGAVEIGKIIEKSSSLREVYLQSNKLGDAGAIELSFGISFN